MYSLDPQHSDGHGAFCLTGTAEVPLGALHMNETLDVNALPLKMVGLGQSLTHYNTAPPPFVQNTL